MTEEIKKYSLGKYISNKDAVSSGVAILGGLVTTVAGVVAHDLETTVAGGAVLVAGFIWNVGLDMASYFKNRIDYMNDNPPRKE
jgi:hypothetical protein